MNPFNFLEYPEYFAFFMIWASGYVFVYSIFSRTNEWKNFDTTMKLVTSLVAGVGIEICIIFPLFFLFPENVETAILLPAFEKTWIYHWALTGFIHISLKKYPDKNSVLKSIHFSFFKILFLFFLTISGISLTLMLEFGNLYPTYVIQSTFWGFYLVLNFTFSAIAVAFCYIFPDYLADAIKNESSNKGKGYIEAIRGKYSLEDIQNFVFLRKVKNKLISFSESKWQFIPSILLIVSASLIIPFDVTVHVFTPNIEISGDTDTFDSRYFLAIESFYHPFDEPPNLEIEFAKITYDQVKIERGAFDQLDSITYSIPSHCLRNEVFIANYPSIHYSPSSLRVIYSEDLEDNVTISKIPYDSTPKKLKIDFLTQGQRDFNFTLSYLTNTTLNNVEVKASKLTREICNSTYDRWTQEYQITNNEKFDIYLEKLAYDQLMYETTEKNSTVLEYNGEIKDWARPNSDTYSNLRLFVGKGKTANVSISFLTTYKNP